jgi:hypothetical protein
VIWEDSDGTAAAVVREGVPDTGFGRHHASAPVGLHRRPLAGESDAMGGHGRDGRVADAVVLAMCCLILSSMPTGALVPQERVAPGRRLSGLQVSVAVIRKGPERL